jgi:hypothetical protein
MEVEIPKVLLVGEGFLMGESRGLLSFPEPWSPECVEEQRRFHRIQRAVEEFVADSVVQA